MSLQPRNLRILQIISSSATSGAEKHAFTLAHMLKQRGHHVEMVVQEGGWMESELPKLGIETHAIPMKGRDTVNAHRWMLKLVNRKRFDVIHAHLTRATYLGFVSGWVRGVPLVSSVHVATSDGIYRRMARRKNRLVAVSEFVRGVLRGRGVPDQFIDVVYNGTDFGDLAEAAVANVHDEFLIPKERRLVGLVGRVCHEKGHMLAVQAMPSVLNRHEDTHLLFVGRFESGFEPTIRKAVSDLGIDDRVTFTGNRADVPRLLDAMAFSILPSTMEACPLAALESMARSKPLVASRVGGLAELVVHEQTGLLVEQTPEELAHGMAFLLEHEDERARMGENARRMIEEKFTLVQMVERLEAVYCRAAGL
mgnify:FL=1